VAKGIAVVAGQTMTDTQLRLALVTMGSLGDVHPMLGLGRAMVARGHHVTLMTNPVFEDLAREQGLAFQPVGTAEQQVQTLKHPKLWHPVDGLGVMWRYLLRPALLPTLGVLDTWRAQASVGERLLVVANPVAFGARLANEAWDLPLVSTYTAATMLRTCTSPMTLAHWRLPPGVPQWVPRLAWAALDRLKLQPLVLPVLNGLRRELGLPALAVSVFGQWMHATLGGLTLFPEWFAPVAPDWPVQVRQGDFPLFDDAAQLDAGLQAFLDAGEPPVVVMPGTGQMHGAALFRAAAQALPALGLRGVLLGPVPAEVSAQVSGGSVWCAAHQSFAKLLPQAKALVHHAGVGSSAQALRAGIPQLLWPQAYDQFDNAWRLEKLGVAARLPVGTPTADGLRSGLARLLASDARTCSNAVSAHRMRHTDQGLARMCQQLEAWA
jgi:rhamnosyltransferase subunit B